MIARGGYIDRRVYRCRRGNELEIGKARNDVARQRGPLAHDTNHIKRQQPLNHGVWIGEVVLKYDDIRSITEHRPIGAFTCRILVIVQNSNLVLLHWLFVHVFPSLIKGSQIVRAILSTTMLRLSALGLRRDPHGSV